jgi:hypothetical protein
MSTNSENQTGDEPTEPHADAVGQSPGESNSVAEACSISAVAATVFKSTDENILNSRN